MKTTLLACLLFVTGSLFARNLDKTFQLLPQPQSVEVLSGKGLNFGELSYVSSAEGASIPVLGEIVNGLPQSKRAGKGVWFQLSTTNVPDSPEGYVLEISDKGVTVTSRDNAGLFYGAQTLEQLLEDSRDFKKEIPSMKITDYPAIAYRAVHLDTKHHLDRMEYYYRMVDKLARYKVNAIIWELEDKLRFTRRPEAGAPNAISKQEMQALCRYAKERNVEISPLVQGLGHAGFILKHHWELRENPASDWEFCPSDPRTYEVQFDLYLDALEAMPYGKYLHVGGDEITAIGIDDRCKATGKSAFELQMVWLKKVCQFAVDHGRIPIFWDDMPLKYAGLWELALS
ncbi:glycoside hydrolase family 20 zincin-like fold domain-containing protein, partial [Parabacteroides leei]